MDRAVHRLNGLPFRMSLTYADVVYTGDVRLEETTLSGRLNDPDGTAGIDVHGDAAAWQVTAEPGQWGGLEQLPFLNVAHTLAQTPDEIVLDLPQGVRLVCHFVDGRKVTAYLVRPGRGNLTIPFEAPEFLRALTAAVRESS